METASEIIDVIKNTLFLAKQLDNFDGFYEPGKDYDIIACKASERLIKKHPGILIYEVIDGARKYSTQSCFKSLFKDYSGIIDWNKYDFYWTYQAYAWTDDLKLAGQKIFCIDYLLFLKLQNKLNQKKILLKRSTALGFKLELLRNNLIMSGKILKTLILPRYRISHEELTAKLGHKYVLCDSYSDGGEGIYKISTKSEFLNALKQMKSMVIRAEVFLKKSIPTNQIAFITSEGQIIKYQPSIQLIRAIHQHNKMEYAGCDFNSEQHLPGGKECLAEISRLTHQIGQLLFEMGYRGSFGCDFLVDECNNVHFIEINPRYQASTLLLTRIMGKHPILAPHILHILGFIKVPILYQSELRELNHPSRYIKLSEAAEFRGFLKVYDKSNKNGFTLTPGIKVDSGVEFGHVFFKESIISSPFYPTSFSSSPS